MPPLGAPPPATAGGGGIPMGRPILLPGREIHPTTPLPGVPRRPSSILEAEPRRRAPDNRICGSHGTPQLTANLPLRTLSNSTWPFGRPAYREKVDDRETALGDKGQEDTGRDSRNKGGDGKEYIHW